MKVYILHDGTGRGVDSVDNVFATRILAETRLLEYVKDWQVDPDAFAIREWEVEE